LVTEEVEMQTLVQGFQVELNGLVAKHRQFVGKGVVAAFVADVGALRLKYSRKADVLRHEGRVSDAAALEDECERLGLVAINEAGAFGVVDAA
jgi:hypothetical protein